MGHNGWLAWGTGLFMNLLINPLLNPLINPLKPKSG
jgi:hypothetical protein